MASVRKTIVTRGAMQATSMIAHEDSATQCASVRAMPRALSELSRVNHFSSKRSIAIRRSTLPARTRSTAVHRPKKQAPMMATSVSVCHSCRVSSATPEAAAQCSRPATPVGCQCGTLEAPRHAERTGPSGSATRWGGHLLAASSPRLRRRRIVITPSAKITPTKSGSHQTDA